MEANILRILVVLIGVALVAVIMVQQPKEGGMGAFTGGGGGSGASSTVFGAKGSGNFLFRLTAGLVLAFTIAIVLLVKVTNSDMGGSVLSTSVTAEAEAIPGSVATANATSDIPGASSNVTDDSIPGASNAPADNSIPGADNTATSVVTTPAASAETPESIPGADTR